jgi:hypothetical protein
MLVAKEGAMRLPIAPSLMGVCGSPHVSGDGLSRYRIVTVATHVDVVLPYLPTTDEYMCSIGRLIPLLSCSVHHSFQLARYGRHHSALPLHGGLSAGLCP